LKGNESEVVRNRICKELHLQRIEFATKIEFARKPPCKERLHLWLG